MINLKKKKKKKKKVPAQLLKRPVPAPYSHPFFIFSEFPYSKEVIKIYLLSQKKLQQN